MMIVPELKTVVIFVPRTGSGSLRRALAAKYPQAFLLYRHMEADGVPFGYDRWRKVGVVRNPVDRLWSLYKFQRQFTPKNDPFKNEAYIASQRAAAERSFDDWIINNRQLFSKQYDMVEFKDHWAVYATHHPLPENLKSQFLYLRPDLGTEIFRFDELPALATKLGIEIEHHNKTEAELAPQLSIEASAHVRKVFRWDIEMTAAAAGKVAA